MDPIGHGENYVYKREDLGFNMPMPLLLGRQGILEPGGVNFMNLRSQWMWMLRLRPPLGQNLDVGEYRDVKRYSSDSDGDSDSPGIALEANGRTYRIIAGEFRIWEIELKNGSVARIAVDFVVRWDEKRPPVVGMLRYNSTFQ